MSESRTADESPSAGGQRSVWMSTVGEHDSARQFGELYDVHAWALPFAAHSIDPMHILTEVGEFLGGRPKSCQRVSKNPLQSGIRVSDDTFWENTILMDNAMLTHGWWKGGKSSVGRYYCNPRYHHRHPESDIFTEWDDRHDFLDDAADIGTVRLHHIAPAFGYNTDSPKTNGSMAKTAAYRCEFPWAERHAAGRHRLIRTWATLSQWGYTHGKIARAFGKSRPTVTKELNRTEFEQDLPIDPTREVMECL